MTGPFRDQETLYLCPRCGDVMVSAFEGVSGCVRCQGTWMPQPIVERVFGSPAWPRGANAWWHRALDCPECATKMNAISADSTLVDRCPAHGAWLDQGELRRLLGARDASDLAALHRTLGLATPYVEIDYASDSLRSRQLELSRQRKAQLALEREAREREEAERRARDEEARSAIAREIAEAERLRKVAREWEQEERRAAEIRAGIERDENRRRVLEAEVKQLASEETTLEAEITRQRDAIAHLERRLTAVRLRRAGLRSDLEGP